MMPTVARLDALDDVHRRHLHEGELQAGDVADRAGGAAGLHVEQEILLGVVALDFAEPVLLHVLLGPGLAGRSGEHADGLALHVREARHAGVLRGGERHVAVVVALREGLAPSRSLVMVIEEIARSMRPELVAAKSAWKPRSWMCMSAPMRLPISFTRSTSKPSNEPSSFLFSHGGLAG